jgi:SAM-dependent methyltransferase
MAFGRVAELYDRARPSYPSELVEDVVALLPCSQDALEVGAGTGKATELFAARGLRVRALEPSAAMAAVARQRCAAYPGVVVEEREFEAIGRPLGAFGLVFSAQAWHWVDPAVRYARAREVLCEEGVLALFWNRPRWERCPLREALLEAYERVAPELEGGPMHPAGEGRQALWVDWTAELSGAAGFGSVQTRLYVWSLEYTTAQYVDLLSSHSSYVVLADSRRDELMAAVAGVIDRAGGSLVVEYGTELFLARAV